MPRATTKAELIKMAAEQFEKMWALVDGMSVAEQTKAFNFGDDFAKKEAHWDRDKNLRDVFVHLYEWHNLLLKWLEANHKKGEKAPFLPVPYNWKTYGEMNVKFWEKHQKTSYDKSKDVLRESHKKVMAEIEKFSDEELFTKKYFPWTGTSSLGQYCVSATASHYDWAIKKIKLHIKTM